MIIHLQSAVTCFSNVFSRQTGHVSKYRMYLLLQWNFLFSLNKIAPVGEMAAVSRIRYTSLQRSQFVLWHGTTPNSSSGLNSAIVSTRFKFAGCLVDKMTLFFIALWSLGDSTLLILVLT